VDATQQDGGISMAKQQREVIGGVDTHGKTHHAAALDGGTGKLLGDQEFPATSRGYADLLRWLQSFGRVVQVGIEGTGSYGAGLFRHLDSQRISVIEVDRPNRRTRRKQGKSDPIDAIAAARAVLAGAASTTPKARSGAVEAIRALRITRTSAVKARTVALNQLASLIVSAPEDLRRGLNDLSRTELISRCARLRIDDTALADPEMATKAALRILARRVQALDIEIRQTTTQLTGLVARTAPTTNAIYGAGTDVTGQLLITAGDNPERLTSEAALARLCGTAPIPASSGNTDRHRLHRGGDRAANAAIYRIVLTRLAHQHQPTRDYVQRRTQQGKKKKEIIRCLKRAVIREIYTALKTDFANLAPTT
jgi:transposase